MMQNRKLDQLIHARFDELYEKLVLRHENRRARAGSERQVVASSSRSLTDAHRGAHECRSVIPTQPLTPDGLCLETVDTARCSICYDFTRPETQSAANTASASNRNYQHKRKRACNPCARLSPCGHIYHQHCIEPWLELRST